MSVVGATASTRVIGPPSGRPGQQPDGHRAIGSLAGRRQPGPGRGDERGDTGSQCGLDDRGEQRNPAANPATAAIVSAIHSVVGNAIRMGFSRSASLNAYTRDNARSLTKLCRLNCLARRAAKVASPSLSA